MDGYTEILKGNPFNSHPPRPNVTHGYDRPLLGPPPTHLQTLALKLNGTLKAGGRLHSNAEEKYFPFPGEGDKGDGVFQIQESGQNHGGGVVLVLDSLNNLGLAYN